MASQTCPWSQIMSWLWWPIYFSCLTSFLRVTMPPSYPLPHFFYIQFISSSHFLKIQLSPPLFFGFQYHIFLCYPNYFFQPKPSSNLHFSEFFHHLFSAFAFSTIFICPYPCYLSTPLLAGHVLPSSPSRQAYLYKTNHGLYVTLTIFTYVCFTLMQGLQILP